MFSQDAYSYLAQGGLLRDGYDPYRDGAIVHPGPLLENVSPVWVTTMPCLSPPGHRLRSLIRWTAPPSPSLIYSRIISA